MNIQQLNGSGQKIWVFFTTAVAALLITGGSWLCSNRLATHRAMMWYKERAAAKKREHEELKGEEYGLLLRIAMLIWLVRNGHASWMWKTGAWSAILTDNKTAGDGRPEVAACEYVSEYSSPEWSELCFQVHPAPRIKWSTPLR